MTVVMDGASQRACGRDVKAGAEVGGKRHVALRDDGNRVNRRASLMGVAEKFGGAVDKFTVTK